MGTPRIHERLGSSQLQQHCITLYQGIPAPYFRLITGIRAARNKPKDLALPDRK